MKSTLEQTKIITESGTISTKYRVILAGLPHVLADLHTTTNFLPSVASLYERIYCVMHNIVSTPVCMVCNENMVFSLGKKQYGKYHRQCSQKSAGVRARYESSMVEKYGSKAPMQNSNIRDKISATMITKYGVPFYTQTSQLKTTNQTNHNGTNISTSKILHAVQYVNDPEWLKIQNISKSLFDIALQVGVSPSLIQKKFQKFGLDPIRHFSSSVEQSMYDSLRNLGCNVEHRKHIGGVEIDLILPELSVGIEVDGLYWHGETKGKHKQYHLDKTNRCASAGIKLIHITDYEWFNKKDIVMSRLGALTNNTHIVGARTCSIKQLDVEARRSFFKTTHIQGDIGASCSYGLYSGGQLVCAMSFGKARYSNIAEWELLRLSSALDTTVMGGASRLLKHFIAQHSPKSIISYCDRRWGVGNVYKQMGFEQVNNTSPNYHYFKSNYIRTGLHSRVKFQRHKLATLFPNSPEEATEWDIMRSNGYDRYWDCGNSVWLLTFDS